MITENNVLRMKPLRSLNLSLEQAIRFDLGLAGKPIYGISAGAILLGPDLDLYAYLYPEDNTEQLASTTAINATTIRIYPHYDVHCEVKPQLPQLITDWEHKTGVTVKRLTNNQGLLVHGSQIKMIDSDS